MAKKPKIPAFAGSLRKDSYTKRVVKTAIEGAKNAGADVTYIDMAEEMTGEKMKASDHQIFRAGRRMGLLLR